MPEEPQHMNSPKTANRMISTREGVGSTAHIVQAAALTTYRLTIQDPMLLHVEQGCKEILSEGLHLTAVAGEFVALAAGQTIDITNKPADGSTYQASWITFDPLTLLEFQRQYNPSSQGVRGALLIGELNAPFGESYKAARAALTQSGEVEVRIVRHRALEVLLWLEQNGLHFLSPNATTTHLRVRKLISADPALPWTCKAIASHLAMSCPTLRRRLMLENVTLLDLLQDVRMSLALSLLQTTDRSILDVAQVAGYASPSRFTMRFKKRFGFLPSAVRAEFRIGNNR